MADLIIQQGINIQNVGRRTVLLLGAKQTGKTTTLSAIIRQAEGMPMLAIDPIGELTRTLIESNAVLIRVSSISPLFLEKIIYLWDKGEKIVLNIRDRSKEEWIPIVEQVSEMFYERQLRNGLILIDEIHEFLRQRVAKHVGYSFALERLVRMGANQDLGFIFSTQRPQLLDKNVLALSDYWIVFRLYYEPDIEPVKEILKRYVDENRMKAFDKNISMLREGEVITIDFKTLSDTEKEDLNSSELTTYQGEKEWQLLERKEDL